LKNNVGKVIVVAILLLTFTAGCGTTNTASQDNTVAVTSANNGTDNSSLLDSSGDLTNLLNKRADGLVKDNTKVAESVTGKGGNGSSNAKTSNNSSEISSKTSTNPNVSSSSSETHVVSASHSSSNGYSSGSHYSGSRSSSGGSASSGSESQGTGQAPAGSYIAYGTSAFGERREFVAPTYSEAQAEVLQWLLATDKEYMIQQGWATYDDTINGVTYHLVNLNMSNTTNSDNNAG
jgi:hypothetical protein